MPEAEGIDVVFRESVHQVLGGNFKFAVNVLIVPAQAERKGMYPMESFPATTRGYPLLFLVGQV